MNNERIRPFSNGSEYDQWEQRNCENCKKYPTEETAQGICSIDEALLQALWDDGTVSSEVWKRMGKRTGICTEQEEIDQPKEFIAITLHQPWATFVALGLKRFETRSWRTKYINS